MAHDAAVDGINHRSFPSGIDWTLNQVVDGGVVIIEL
jgi:hypothetical protein